MDRIIRAQGLFKSFTLHTQGRVRIPVLNDFHFEAGPGESVALVGPSGAGKSTFMRLLYGNYRAEKGIIEVRHRGGIVDLAQSDPHEILDLRRWTIGHVSQFLRIVPRVPALEVVMEPMLDRGMERENAAEKARGLLQKLRIPSRMWSLSPTTFSGGEQQRINLARGFSVFYPILLLDEPTASLDPLNAGTTIRMIREAMDSGTTVIGIFHDKDLRDTVAQRCVEITGIGLNG